MQHFNEGLDQTTNGFSILHTTGMPFLTIFLSIFSNIESMDMLLSVVLKITSLITFCIYVILNYEGIKKQINAWFNKPKK